MTEWTIESNVVDTAVNTLMGMSLVTNIHVGIGMTEEHGWHVYLRGDNGHTARIPHTFPSVFTLAINIVRDYEKTCSELPAFKGRHDVIMDEYHEEL